MGTVLMKSIASVAQVDRATLRSLRAPRGLEENISMRVAEPSSPGAAANAGTPGDCGDLAPYLSAGHFERSERRECQGTRTSRSER